MAQVQHSSRAQITQLTWLPKQFVAGRSGGQSFFPERNAEFLPGSSTGVRRRGGNVYGNGVIKASVTFKDFWPSSTKRTVKALVTVIVPLTDPFKNLGMSVVPDIITDLFGYSLELELVAAELNNKGKEKKNASGHAHYAKRESLRVVKYEADIQVPRDFGPVGAIQVRNYHTKEIFIKDITLQDLPGGPCLFSCNSWVSPSPILTTPHKRVFFTNKSYLPEKTPEGIKKLRGHDLDELRGDGTGERERGDRIYDYDVYNDLGDPDSSSDLERPVLGGKDHPYPRRCRTGRPPSQNDDEMESKSCHRFYVPRDECFSEVKSIQFMATTVYTALHAVLPTLDEVLVDRERRFPYFTAIDDLYNEGIHVPALEKNLRNLIPRIIKSAQDAENDVLLFETPELMDRDKFSWLRDEEFARQTLAGINPYSIRLVKEEEWPLKSTLDSKVYGLEASKITPALVEKEIQSYTMTVKEALNQKKLFLLDYHDLFLPYVNKVREMESGAMLYGSRTLFFLTPDGTLKPIAIELARPLSEHKPAWQEVFTPSSHATQAWLWKLAKVHVLAHDSAHHQLISHWLRTHCATEPYIIATNRQLSTMHPIYRLLKPHFVNTMNINALAREALIEADGVIETTFTASKYAMEISSVVYDLNWRFDREGLPADLINRGLAVEDPNAPHGLKLTIEDYPFANDGLILWDTIKQWVTDYVKHYYPRASLVEGDKELQAWWTEIRTVGHADKKDEPWWPVLKTQDDLIRILTIIIWVASGHHAAVNFGQYDYAGFFPNRPTIARAKIPSEDPTEEQWKHFEERPEDVLMQTLPSQRQATKVMTVLDVLSTHSPDEEYIGKDIEPFWEEDEAIKAAFDRFSGRLMELEGTIEARNLDKNLKNRTGTGVVPYKLLKPFSEAGLTGMGVPNSISI